MSDLLRHLRLRKSPRRRVVRLDDGRLLTEFWVDGSYQAVTGLEGFLRLAGLRFGPGAP